MLTLTLSKNTNGHAYCPLAYSCLAQKEFMGSHEYMRVNGWQYSAIELVTIVTDTTSGSFLH